MRVLVGAFIGCAAMVAACGAGAVVAPKPATPTAEVARLAGKRPVVVDVLAALAETSETVSWIVPGLAQLELGGAAIQAPPAAGELAVMMFDDQGPMVRVGVTIDHAAFALWVERARLLGVVAHDQIASSRPGGEYTPYAAEPIEAELHRGARVRRLRHRDGWTEIRYLGALEVDGWIPDGALVDHGSGSDTPGGRIPTGRPALMVTPGTVIRTETTWSARELAVMATGYFVDTIKELDDAWVEVSYEDSDVRVHGFVSKHDPPGRVHKPHEAETPPPAITPNATVPTGTCLYAVEGGEPIGYVIGDPPAELAPGRTSGWFAVSLDTPWGPIVFAARGLVDHDLATCGPHAAPPTP